MTQAFLTMLDERLAATQRKEVVVYVHGFNETFESAAFTLAELCHFLGREFVCVMYSWPAGSGGNLLTGYGRDRESSEFGMFHLKRIIRLIGRSQQVKEMQLIAHSRGTDVLLSAFRALAIENHAAGIPASASKLGHIVLLAPDVDQEIAAQRVAPIPADPDIPTAKGEPHLGIRQEIRATIYVSPEDRALLASAFLFRSKRLGRFDVETMDQDMADFWESLGKVQMIQAPTTRTDRFGHSYFTSNPNVSSDLIQLLRYDRVPGDPERSLRPVAAPLIWQIVEPD